MTTATKELAAVDPPLVATIKSLLLHRESADIWDIDGTDDEVHVIYRYFSEGRRMESTLIITDVVEDELES